MNYMKGKKEGSGMTISEYGKKQLVEEKVFKDPVHRYIHVRDQVIWDLIKTKEFQRLRRIKQLGTLYLAFHSAEHSRFNHSLGVYEIVRRMVVNFQEFEEWNNDDRLLALFLLYRRKLRQLRHGAHTPRHAPEPGGGHHQGERHACR